MARTLYLHIGSHKTGTTSIQHFLAGQTEELARRGYAYPVSANGLNLGGVIGGLSEGEDEMDEGGITRRTRQAISLICEGDAQVVIASSEGFSYMNDPAEIKALGRRLRRSFARIKIITYLRRQDQFAVSHHQEGANPQVKRATKLHGHRPTALPETSPLQQKYLDYGTRIGMWGDAFGDKDVIVRVYDRALLKNGDSVADFLELVGLGDMEIGEPVARNTSMGFVKTKLGHILNEFVPDMAAKKAVLARLPEGGKLMPSRAEAMAFVEPYLAGNRRLNRRFKISEERSLFSKDYSMYPEEAQEAWSDETSTQALRACVEVIAELSSSKLVFDHEEYSAAAKALEKSRPVLAKRFLDAAMGIRPTSEKLKQRAEKLQSQKKPGRRAGAGRAKSGEGRARRRGARAEASSEAESG